MSNESENVTDLMTADEIHHFGIEVVHNYMTENGFEILSVVTDLGINPQIVARKDGELAMVAVRTACYPDKGSIESQEIAQKLIAFADSKNALCYFAPVGIANVDGSNDLEMSLPKKGAPFAVAFEGLLVLTSTDRIAPLR